MISAKKATQVLDLCAGKTAQRITNIFLVPSVGNQNLTEEDLETGDKVTVRKKMEAKTSVKSGDSFGIQSVVKVFGHLLVVFALRSVPME